MSRLDWCQRVLLHRDCYDWKDDHCDGCNIFKAFCKGAEQAKQKWIPVTERLPSDGGNYLVTVADLRLGHNGEHTVTMAEFYAKAKKWNSIVDVYAWMPLPEPHKGGEEE